MMAPPPGALMCESAALPIGAAARRNMARVAAVSVVVAAGICLGLTACTQTGGAPGAPAKAAISTTSTLHTAAPRLSGAAATSSTAAAGAPGGAPAGGASRVTAAPTTSTTFAFTNCPPTFPSTAPPPGVSVRLTLPKQVFGSDEDVPMTLSLYNGSGQVISHNWPTGQPAYDVWMNTGSRTMWRWSYGSTSAGGGPDYLQPGQTESYNVTWNGAECDDGHQVIPQRSPGLYTVQGYFVDNSNAWYSESVQIEVK